MSPLLFGLHDRQAAPHVPDGGWCVDTIALSENPAPQVYDQRINWIVRVNWGYGSTGTIPLPKDDNLYFDRLAHYVHNSKDARIWIIGNEVNHEQERPDGVFITPQRYAAFFLRARTLIKTIDSSHQVLPSPMAPYHANPVNWLEYWQEMLGLIADNGGCDGVAVHAYTRSSKPEDITSKAKMGPPLEGQYSGFWTYMDALAAVPSSLNKLPAYITEFNELLDGGWDDRNTGVVQAAYRDVDDWSHDDDILPIQCLILYRWPKFDKWHIEGKNGVIADFQAAVALGYTSSTVEAQTMGEQTHLPSVSTGTPATEPSLPPRQIDPRLTQRGVTIETPALAPGQQFWRIVKAQWWNEQESQGRHHIYVEASANTPFWALGEGSETKGVTNGKTGFDAANAPMWASEGKNGYSVWINDGKPSESLEGVGMGADTPEGFNAGVHTSTGATFQLVTMPAATTPTQPTPVPVTGPTATPITPAGARIRSGPGVTFSVLGAVPFGTPMRVTGMGPSGTWYRVDSPFGMGWVSATVVSAKNIGNVPVVDAVPTEPTPSGDKWERSIAFVLEKEGGFQNNPADKGNYYKGQLIGTKFGISAASWGGQYDIPNLTVEQAKNIYAEHYWRKSGADRLEWPLCLLVLDSSVLHGTGAAEAWLKEVGPNPYAFASKRLHVYTKSDNGDTFWRGWVNRVGDLLEEMHQ